MISMKINRKTKERWLLIGRILILVIFMLIVLIPIYWMLVTSLKFPEDINTLDIQYLPKNATLDNYRAVLGSSNFLVYLKNSIFVSVITGIIVLFVAITGGYGLSRYRYKGKNLTMVGFLITQMIPLTLILVPMFLIFNSVKLGDSLTSLIILYVVLNVPFCVITMQGFFANIPVAIEEAAAIDGCSKLQTICRVVLPIMLPGIIAVFIFAFIGAWNDLLGGIMFINSELNKTIPVGLSYYVGQFSINWGEMSAGGMLALLPSALLFAFAQKYIVSGMTSGSVKG